MPEMSSADLVYLAIELNTESVELTNNYVKAQAHNDALHEVRAQAILLDMPLSEAGAANLSLSVQHYFRLIRKGEQDVQKVKSALSDLISEAHVAFAAYACEEVERLESIIPNPNAN